MAGIVQAPQKIQHQGGQTPGVTREKTSVRVRALVRLTRAGVRVLGRRLAWLGVDLRREVVRELTEGGLSTRAIAPVVGISKSQVATDQQVSSAGHLIPTPAPSGAGPAPASAGSTPKAAQDEENDGAAARVETDDSTAATPEGETPARWAAGDGHGRRRR